MKGMTVMKIRYSAATAALLCACAIAAPASAATYTETLNLPAYRTGQPYILQSTSDFSSGVKLTAADVVSNPDGWNNALNVTLDTVARTITFSGDGFNSYQTIDFTVTGITGVKITGLTAITPFGAFGDFANTSLTSSFTDSSIQIGWAVNNIAGGDYFTINPGSSVFSYSVAGVPEPATWALMILGFGAVGGAMRRRQSVAAKVRFA